jgi:hypothetical protein
MYFLKIWLELQTGGVGSVRNKKKYCMTVDEMLSSGSSASGVNFLLNG